MRLVDILRSWASQRRGKTKQGPGKGGGRCGSYFRRRTQRRRTQRGGQAQGKPQGLRLQWSTGDVNRAQHHCETDSSGQFTFLPHQPGATSLAIIGVYSTAPQQAHAAECCWDMTWKRSSDCQHQQHDIDNHHTSVPTDDRGQFVVTKVSVCLECRSSRPVW